MKVLVCGGRDYNDYVKVDWVLNSIHHNTPITSMIHGKAKGADTLGGEWAKLRNIEVTECPAEWSKYGKSADYIRNRYMASLNPDLVVAFPGGKGTAMMINIAKDKKIPVTVVA